MSTGKYVNIGDMNEFVQRVRFSCFHWSIDAI